MRVLVMGLGYVGLPLAVQAAMSGHEVTGYDPSISRVLGIQKGESPVEDVSDERLKKALETRLTVVAREDLIYRADVVVICVPTPLTKGRPDLSHVESAVRTAGYRALHAETTVILESTTHPGTTRNLVVPILERAGKVAGEDFYVGFSPERIDPGNKDYHFGNTVKLVSGLTYECLSHVASFYGSMGVPVHSMASMENAEMAKILENTFRHVNIALVNELTRVATSLNVDMWDVIEGAATKPYGFMPFYPGPGVGGHCLPVDPAYLTEHVRAELGQSLGMVELALDVNREQPAYVVSRVQDALNERERALKNSEVLVLGLAYKPDTADVRESPSFDIIEGLLDKGARVSVVDPVAPTVRAEVMGAHALDLATVDFTNFDAVVLVTNHAEFDLQHIAKASYVLDTRGVMDLADNIERL